MLLKCCQTEKKTKTSGNTQKRSAGNSMRLTSTTTQMAPRAQRKVALKRTLRGMKEEPAVDPICDNSNDSGLGFEQHQEYNVALRVIDWPCGERLGLSRDQGWVNNESPEVKRKRLEIKIESDDANDNFTFPDNVRQRTEHLLPSPPYPVAKHMSAPRPIKRRTQTAVTTSQLLGIHKDSKPPRGRVPGSNILTSQLLGLHGKGRKQSVPSLAANQTAAVSRNGKTQLVIVSQPEQQHRARYQTEGSRGAVKDRTGNGFPQVKLTGWLGTATLEVYIGSDCGKVVPHMFYQACRVSGKNSTQCQERTEEGTVIIEIPVEPTKDMVVTCDCVGILKERNVDVEHRFPEQSGSRNKKKSTRCRMVFRTFLTHPDGSQETLQICSQPIACTQPPGVPEICKKSLTSSPADGGSELFILGKNFLKDTQVLFTNPDLQPPWEASVVPDKEYLQQSHLVCVVPPYHSQNITEPVTVRLTVVSSDKASEAHCFTYTPQQPVDPADGGSQSVIKAVHPEVNPPVSESGEVGHSSLLTATTTDQVLLVPTNGNAPRKSAATKPVDPMLPSSAAQYLLVEPKQGGDRESIFPLVMWKSVGSDGAKLMSVSSKAKDMKILSIPAARKNFLPALVPSRRLSASEIKTEREERVASSEGGVFPNNVKGIDLHIKPVAAPGLKVSMATGADLSSTLPPTMATLRRFVANDNGSPLPSLSVENFLSRLESKAENAKKAGSVPQPDRILPDESVTLQPEYVPLDSVIALHMPLTSRAQIVSDFRRLSDEEMVSSPLESSPGFHRKPCNTKDLNALHYHTSATPASNPQNGNVNASSAADQSSSVGQQQMTFTLQSPASSEGHQMTSLDSHFLSQDLQTSSATSCVMDASDALCQQSPQHMCNECTMSTKVNAFNVGSVESSATNSPVGNGNTPRQSPEFVSLPEYEESSCLDNLQTQEKDNSTPLNRTTPFTSYVRDESMHSPPIDSKGSVMLLQEPTFKTHRTVHVELLPCIERNNVLLNAQTQMSTGSFISDGIPIASQPMSMSSQVLPVLNNNHILSNLQCVPLPTIAEKARLIQDQDLSHVGNYETRSSSLCSPPIAIKNILIHPQEPSLFANYTSQNVPTMSIGQSQMSQANNVVVEAHHSSTLKGMTTECQMLANTHVGSVHAVGNSALLDLNILKTHIDFEGKNRVVTSSSPILDANQKISVHSQDKPTLCNFTQENLTCSPPGKCISSHNSGHLGSHELSPLTTKTSVNNFSLMHVTPDAAHASVDTRVADSGLRQNLHDTVVVTSSLCSLPSTTSTMLTAHSQPMTHDTMSRDPLPVGCSSVSKLQVDNVQTSLMTLSNLLLHPDVPLTSGSSLSNHCPSVAMNNLFLNCSMMGSENNVPNTCSPLESSISASSPVPPVHNNASQIAMKGMMLRVDVSSTMDHPIILQPGAVTPETVRLDALVNSTLDNHINPMRDPQSKSEVHTDSSVADRPTSGTTLLDMFPHTKESQAGHLQLDSSLGQAAFNIAQDLLCEATNTSKCIQLNSSPGNTIHSKNELPSGPTPTTGTSGGFAVMSTNTAQYGVPSDQCFTSAPTNLHFTCVTTNSRNLGQLMDLEEHRIKTETTQKVGLKDGIARREEGMLPHELTQMSDHDLISYINPSCFDQV